MKNNLTTDVYMKTEHLKSKKSKTSFSVIINKVLVGAIILTSLTSATTPAFASQSQSEPSNINLSTTITQNYEVSVENAIHNVRETIKAIEVMKKEGKVTDSILSKLAEEIYNLDKAINLSETQVSDKIVDTILNAEDTIKEVKGSEKAMAAISVAKQSLGITSVSGKIDVEKAKSTQVQLTDISNHWGKSYIEELISLGSISGYPDGTFKPENTISVAEFLSLSINSFYKNELIDKRDNEHWANPVYQTAIEKGIIKPSEFKGTAEVFSSPISREDMALIMVRLNEVAQENNQVDASKMKSAINDYSTISSNRTYFVEQAYKKGILQGSNNNFNPKGNLKRAEAATAIINLLNYKEGTVIADPAAVKTGTEKAKEIFDAIPVYNEKTNHGLKFEGVGYTLDDVAVFAKGYLSAFLNYDATDKASIDKWEKDTLSYMVPGSAEGIVKLKQQLIDGKDKCQADIYVDATKIEIKNGKFLVHAIAFDYVSGRTYNVDIQVAGHNVNKDKIAVDLWSMKEVK